MTLLKKDVVQLRSDYNQTLSNIVVFASFYSELVSSYNVRNCHRFVVECHSIGMGH